MNTTKPTKGEVRPNHTQDSTETQATASTAGTGPTPAHIPKDHAIALSRCLEMSKELRDARERHGVLAYQIGFLLKPGPCGNSPEPSGWRLAEVLDELLGDFGQSNRLVETLEGLCEAMGVDHA